MNQKFYYRNIKIETLGAAETKDTMYVTKSINADHEDLIHDVAYDFYGKRMATCSSDQKVKVWDQDEAGLTIMY